MTKLLFAALLASSAVCAQAETLTFDSATQNSIFGPTYSEGGYTLTGSGFEFPQFDAFAFTTFANDGSLTLNYKGPTYTLTKDGGGTFDFAQFQLGNVNNSIFGGTLRVSFDGATPQRLAIPIDGTLATYRFNAKGVTSAAFSYIPGETANNTLNSYARIDNVVLNAVAVPEPATWALMIGGMGVVGGTLRRRRTLVAHAA